MDYRQQTINKIRELYNFGISDKKLEYLYHMWSEHTCSAGWVIPNAEDINRFCIWTHTTPLKSIEDMPESDFE